MNVLDILLLVAAVWFAIVGFRQGFVVGILSVIGFLGGGAFAEHLLRCLLIVPETFAQAEVVQPLDTMPQTVDVKDTSPAHRGAVRGPRGFRGSR